MSEQRAAVARSHAETITRELGALAEMGFLAEQLLHELDGAGVSDKTRGALERAIDGGKRIVVDRLRVREEDPRDPGPTTAHAQLTAALGGLTVMRKAARDNGFDPTGTGL